MTRRSLIQTYLRQLTIPLRPIKITGQIAERIGPLSNPSKMPFYSWDISASLCKTGSILHKQEDTPCSKCYALGRRYKFSNVANANQRRLQGYLNDPDWVLLMAIRLLNQRGQYFRWFSSGDLQDTQMFRKIITVCYLTLDYVNHWLPTQERSFVKEHADYIPHNLCVRISSTKLNQPQYSSIPNTTNSSVVADNWTCPSSLYNNTCGTCRACWDKNIPLIAYKMH